jgi:hypothetical protein
MKNQALTVPGSNPLTELERACWQRIILILAQRAKPVLVTLRFGVIALSRAVPAPASAPTSPRPISDFVSQQGTFCFPDGRGGSVIFVPPLPNFIGWSDWRSGNNAWVDYAGLANAACGGDFGTQTRGTVIERPLPDGRADVTVTLHTTKALTWVIERCSDFAGATPVFGHRAADVLAGAEAALGESFLQLSFTNSAPGAPLADLMQLFFLPAPGQQLHKYVFYAMAKGPLRNAFGVPNSTPGMVTVAETGNTARSNIQAAVVNLRKTGN